MFLLPLGEDFQNPLFQLLWNTVLLNTLTLLCSRPPHPISPISPNSVPVSRSLPDLLLLTFSLHWKPLLHSVFNMIGLCSFHKIYTCRSAPGLFHFSTVSFGSSLSLQMTDITLLSGWIVLYCVDILHLHKAFSIISWCLWRLIPQEAVLPWTECRCPEPHQRDFLWINLCEAAGSGSHFVFNFWGSSILFSVMVF